MIGMKGEAMRILSEYDRKHKEGDNQIHFGVLAIVEDEIKFFKERGVVEQYAYEDTDWE